MQGTIAVPGGAASLGRLLAFLGPGLLVSVGYMDPGNWATDIEAGSRYGYALLWAVVVSSLAAIALQTLAVRLGIGTGRDLARLCRERYPRPVALGLWILAEIAVIACDVAEVLGSALAFKILLHVPLALGVLLTALDAVIVLGFQGQGFRRLEAMVLGLVTTIALTFLAELAFAPPDWAAAARGLVPDGRVLVDGRMLYLAVGILGATVMPHNLYLHSSIVQTRRARPGAAGGREAAGFATLDAAGSLLIALLVNAAILLVAASAFHDRGARAVAGIDQAARLLAPLTGAGAAGLLFAVGLLASGQSSTFTGTIAGQVILEGFLDLRIPCWRRRLITRALALLPALAGVLLLGEGGVGQLLVLSQVVLSAQLPFAILPLLLFARDRELMGPLRTPLWLHLLGWAIFLTITAANLWLIPRALAG